MAGNPTALRHQTLVSFCVMQMHYKCVNKCFFMTKMIIVMCLCQEYEIFFKNIYIYSYFWHKRVMIIRFLMHFILQAISNISSTAYYKCSDVGSIIQNKIQVSIW